MVKGFGGFGSGFWVLVLGFRILRRTAVVVSRSRPRHVQRGRFPAGPPGRRLQFWYSGGLVVSEP